MTTRTKFSFLLGPRYRRQAQAHRRPNHHRAQSLLLWQRQALRFLPPRLLTAPALRQVQVTQFPALCPVQRAARQLQALTQPPLAQSSCHHLAFLHHRPTLHLYSRPAPPKPPSEPVKEEPTIIPLPLVAPAVSEFSASEPVISQLASVIDNLASFLNSNPSAADKARDILDGAKGDLKQLATRIEEAKEEERHKLEASIDEQTCAFTIKLLELEMEAQDKLDNQEDDFRKYFEEEKAKFVAAYREKLNRELQTQSEIINER